MGPQDVNELVEPKLCFLESEDSQRAWAKEERLTTPLEDKQRDIFQFSSSIYYCQEDEGLVQLVVSRLGHCNTSGSVRYCTQDMSAKAGHRYVAGEGILHFAPDQTSAVIIIDLIGNEAYDSTCEFEVILTDPEGADLGLYLFRSSVVISDDDTFPTNRFQHQLRNMHHREQANKLPTWPLMMEYLRMNLQVRELRNRSLIQAVLDQVVNMRYVWNIWLAMLLFDYVLVAKADEGHSFIGPVLKELGTEKSVWVIMALTVLPYPFVMCIQIFQVNLRIAGIAISRLQENLMRRYLSLDEDAHRVVCSADINMAINNDVSDLVRMGFCTIFPILEKVGLLVLLLFFALYQQAQTNPFDTVTLFLLFPIAMTCFLLVRQKGSLQRRQQKYDCAVDIADFTERVADSYRLIADYIQRTARVQVFTARVKAGNTAITNYLRYGVVNESFAPTLTMIVTGLYILRTWEKVIEKEGNFSIGQFVAGVSCWLRIGQCYQELYQHLLEIQDAIEALHNICFYMNLETVVPSQMKRSRWLLSNGSQALANAHSHLHGKDGDADCPCPFVSNTIWIGRKNSQFQQRASFAEDMLLIRCHNVTYEYHDAHGNVTASILRHASFALPQGRLVAITGSRGSGKATLLRVLGGVVAPRENHNDGEGFFVPPHLRVLHVTYQPKIVSDLGLLDNVCFGPSDGSDEDIVRVSSICRRLGVTEEIIRLMEEEAKAPPHSEKCDEECVHNQALEMTQNDGGLMSFTDRCLLHLARALVMNPEVLVIHKPLVQFDNQFAKRVLLLLREFVDFRGIEKSVEGRVRRRPRTCIFSVGASEGTESADTVLNIDAGQVTLVDVDLLHRMREVCHELFVTLNEDGGTDVTLKEFCHVVPTQQWIMDILGITERQANGSPEEMQEFLEIVFDTIDEGGDGSVDVDELVHFLHCRELVKQKSKKRRGEIALPGGNRGPQADRPPPEPGDSAQGMPPETFDGGGTILTALDWKDCDPVPQETELPAQPATSSRVIRSEKSLDDAPLVKQTATSREAAGRSMNGASTRRAIDGIGCCNGGCYPAPPASPATPMSIVRPLDPRKLDPRKQSPNLFPDPMAPGVT